MTDRPELLFRGLIEGPAGYDRLNRRLLEGLHLAGVRVRLWPDRQPVENRIALEAADRRLIDSCLHTKVSDRAPFLHSTIAHGFYADVARYRIGLTMWEAHDTIPPEFAERCNRMHEIWVPSEQCQRTFAEGGVKVPILRMPLGVDLEQFNPNVEPVWNILAGTRGFRALCVVGHSHRKGFAELLRAWYTAFDGSDDATLIYKGYFAGSASRSAQARVMSDLRAVKAEFDPGPNGHAHVVALPELLDEADMPGLYASCDLFALMTLGEGFCLPALEAAACGRPSLITAAGGHMDYLRDDADRPDEANAFLVPPRGWEAARDDVVDACHLYKGLRFPIIDVARAAATLRSCYENRDEVLRRGRRARRTVEEMGLTWRALGARAAARVADVNAGLLLAGAATRIERMALTKEQLP